MADLTNYDFESKLEQGFKTLFASASIVLFIADDVDGELPDEHVRLELTVGAVISDQKQDASGNYNNYAGTLEVVIETPRVANDQVSIATGFNSRHAELVAIARKALEEIDATALSTNWPGALSPTKITPTGTERENDAEHRMTTLSYDMQFRIA